jgi:hypothetical protein
LIELTTGCFTAFIKVIPSLAGKYKSPFTNVFNQLMLPMLVPPKSLSAPTTGEQNHRSFL